MNEVFMRTTALVFLFCLSFFDSGCRTVRSATIYHANDDSETGLPRHVFVPGVPNFRDIGGWKTDNGLKIRTGKLYRSAAFDRKRKWYYLNQPVLPDESARFIKEELRVKTEIDLRSDDEARYLECSCLGEGVRYVRVPTPEYAAIDTPSGRRAFAEVFRVLLDESAYPVVIHCKFGRDRTGTVVYLLNALAGVSENCLRRDWEMSHIWFSTMRYSHADYTQDIRSVMNRYPGNTLSAKVFSFIKTLGFSEKEINSYIERMTTSE